MGVLHSIAISFVIMKIQYTWVLARKLNLLEEGRGVLYTICDVIVVSAKLGLYFVHDL